MLYRTCLYFQVHDYVRNYLGESREMGDFAKQFLEKRSHYKNKARNEKRQDEVFFQNITNILG